VDWNELVDPMEDFFFGWLIDLLFSIFFKHRVFLHTQFKQKQNVATPWMNWMFYLPTLQPMQWLKVLLSYGLSEFIA
jgi:hypothetical protein